MARPKSKPELIEQSAAYFEKLNKLIDGYSEQERYAEFPEGTLNRNIRDVLAHLYHWHLLMNEWYEVGMSGEKPDIPAKGYTWKTTPELNRWINEEYSEAPLDDIRDRLNETHSQMMKLIESHSDEELFTKKYYPWTGSTSLGAYFISATASHYDWAFKLIRKAKK